MTYDFPAMTNENPEQQRQRLATLYFDMTDGELLKLKEEPATLTGAAQEALRSEMKRRGLADSTKSPQVEDEIELQKLVTLRQFRDLPEALLAKGALESADIECFLQGENANSLLALAFRARLLVHKQDEDTAREILGSAADELTPDEIIAEEHLHD